MIDDHSTAILFLTIILILFTSQIPFHTLITESFDTVERIKNYGLLYLFGKTSALISPFTLEYLDKDYYEGITISVSVLIILMIINVKETFNMI